MSTTSTNRPCPTCGQTEGKQWDLAEGAFHDHVCPDCYREMPMGKKLNHNRTQDGLPLKRHALKEMYRNLSRATMYEPSVYELALSVFDMYQNDIYEEKKYSNKPAPSFTEWCKERIIEVRLL